MVKARGGKGSEAYRCRSRTFFAENADPRVSQPIAAESSYETSCNSGLITLGIGRLLLGVQCSALILLFSGCGGDTTARKRVPDPLLGAAPSITTTLAYTRQSIVAGTTDREIADIRLESSLHLNIQILAMTQVPVSMLDPIQDHIRLVVLSPERRMLAPAAHLTPGGRFGVGGGDWQLMEDLRAQRTDQGRIVQNKQAVLPLGVVVEFDIETPNGQNPLGNQLRVLIMRRQEPDPQNHGAPRDFVELALVRSGAIPGEIQSLSSSRLSWEEGTLGPQDVTERVILKPIVVGDVLNLALMIPFAWDSPWAKALVLLLTLEPISDPASDKEVKREFSHCLDVLQQEADRIHPQREGNPVWAGCLQSLEFLMDAEHRRQALVFLTENTPTALAYNLALAAPEPVARDLALRVQKHHHDTPSQDRSSLGWVLEKQAFLVLLDMDDRGLLVEALEMLLVRHAGYLGRQRALLRELLNLAHDQADFQRRMIRENHISLEDMSPAVRVCAYEWLMRQGQAPAGYDPLASAQERRRVLDISSDQNKGQN